MVSVPHKRVCMIALTVSLTSTLCAQEYKYEIGGMTGGSFYMGDANKNQLFASIHPSFGGVFRYNYNLRWAVKADLMWGQVSGSTIGSANAFPSPAQTSFTRNMFDVGGQLEFNFFPYSDKFAYLNAQRFTPYILAGLGATVAPGGGETFAGINIPVGAGVKYKIKNRINLGLEWSMRKLFGDNFDSASLNAPYGIESGGWKNQDWYSFVLLFVSWDFGLRCGTCNNRYTTVK